MLYLDIAPQGTTYVHALRSFTLTTLFLPSAIHPRAYRRSTLHSRAQDHITLEDYEIHDGDGLELYYN